MIKVVCAMFIITNKNLEVRLDNLNLPFQKNTIEFELLAQKRETSKQTTDALYYK